MTIAANSVGYGHLSRCINLAKATRQAGAYAEFLLLGDASAAQRLDQAKFACRLLPYSTVSSGEGALDLRLSGMFDGVIVDFTCPPVLANIDVTRALFQSFRQTSGNLILVDAVGSQGLVSSLLELPVDVVAIPYIGAFATGGTRWRTLAGAQYAVLGEVYSDLPPRRQRHFGERVLVTCGGADPTRLTARVLKALGQISRPVLTRVIIGPLFDSTLTADIEAIAAVSPTQVDLVRSPDALVDHMLWCDIAVSTTGLTKYELAASATPSILASIDTAHYVANRAFAAIGFVRDLGVNPPGSTISRTVEEVLADYSGRETMAAIGSKLVDGRGAERLTTEILRTCREH